MSGPSSTEEAKASAQLRHGSLAAIAGSLLGLAAPTAVLLLARGGVDGLSSGATATLTSESLLVVAGAILLLVALLLYRKAFGHLKHVDRRLRPVSAVCLVGSVGALALVVAGAYVAGGSSTVGGCLNGHVEHALSCLRSHDPTAGYLAVAGFWLLWAGAAGVATGLILAGRHFSRGAMTAGGVVYAVLVADLAIPFAALLVTLPLAGLALGVAPVAAVVAPCLVFVGARSALAPRD